MSWSLLGHRDKFLKDDPLAFPLTQWGSWYTLKSPEERTLRVLLTAMLNTTPDDILDRDLVTLDVMSVVKPDVTTRMGSGETDEAFVSWKVWYVKEQT